MDEYSQADTAMTALIVLLDAILAVSGYVGGRNLTKDPSGSTLHLRSSWLQRVPLVKDYFWPGVFLLITFAYGASLAALATIRHFAWAQELNIALGSILVIWVIVELLIIPKKHFIQLIYFLIGLSLIILALL